MYAPWNNDFTDVGVGAIGYSYRFGSINGITDLPLPDVIGDHLYIEGEVGASKRFGNEELFVRWHHRSGVFGLFDGVRAGSTFLTGGVRLRF